MYCFFWFYILLTLLFSFVCYSYLALYSNLCYSHSLMQTCKQKTVPSHPLAHKYWHMGSKVKIPWLFKDFPGPHVKYSRTGFHTTQSHNWRLIEHNKFVPGTLCSGFHTTQSHNWRLIEHNKFVPGTLCYVLISGVVFAFYLIWYCKVLYFHGPKSLWIWHFQNLHPLNSVFCMKIECVMWNFCTFDVRVWHCIRENKRLVKVKGFTVTVLLFILTQHVMDGVLTKLC
jgi:hypothetical protein